MVQEKREQKKIWQYPWGYKESFMVVLELLLSGLIFQVLAGGRQFGGLHWPINLIAGLVFILLLIMIHLFFRHTPFVRWLSSVPAAVSSITFFAFLVLLIGFIPQQDPDAPGIIKILGLNSIRNSWLMLVSGLFLLTCLGLVILRRALPLNRRNIGFLLNHAGLWIVLFAGSLSTGDLKRISVQLTEGYKYINTGIDQSGKEVQLPFGLKLLDFSIDEYPPEIGIGNSKTGELIDDSGIKLSRIREKQEYIINEWKIVVNKVIANAYPANEGFFSLDSVGASPAAFVSVQNTRTNESIQGWISCGSNAFSPTFLYLNNEEVLFMDFPKPSKYSSLIGIIHDNVTDTVSIEVNNPVHIQGYSIYQLSYDERFGKWSPISVIEAVKDPWLPVVYIGIILVLAGSAYLFWKGNQTRKG
jgi:hypothetical protein